MLKHTTIPASELRNGDLMRLGTSTNYVLVHSTETVAGRVQVTIYNGAAANENGPTLAYAPGDTVDLSMRDAKP